MSLIKSGPGPRSRGSPSPSLGLSLPKRAFTWPLGPELSQMTTLGLHTWDQATDPQALVCHVLASQTHPDTPMVTHPHDAPIPPLSRGVHSLSP